MVDGDEARAESGAPPGGDARPGGDPRRGGKARRGGKTRILIGFGLGVLALDFATKRIVEETFFLGQSVEVVGSFFRLTYILNPGAAFGIHAGEHSRWIFVALSSVILVLLIAMYRSTPGIDRHRLVAIASIVGGALGNLLDRITSSRGVVDFFDVGIGSMRFPVFNVADIGITVGAVLLAFSMWHEGEEGIPAAPPDSADAAAGDPPARRLGVEGLPAEQSGLRGERGGDE